MRFHDDAISKAFARQYDREGVGIPCARCQKGLDTIGNEGQGWFAIPRIPVEQGGKGAFNCVIVCPKCYDKLGQDGTKVIPYSELRYFEG